MIDSAGNARKIVEALKETEAESEGNRVLSPRAVELLYHSGVTRIISPADSSSWYHGMSMPGSLIQRQDLSPMSEYHHV
jgi:hypothetical protein